MRRTLRGVKGYRLKIQRLDFISAVDAGAQGPIANVALIKRAPQGGLDITCKVTKLEPSLGLVFGWAMAGTTDGGKTDHVDLQSDAIEVNTDDFIKACAEFMEEGAASDVMHDGTQDGRIVFAMPLVKQVNDALGIKSDVEGFAIAMKPSPETFKRFVSGELNAFSIAGTGERQKLASATRKATWTTATVDDFPDSSFLYIEPGGTKDSADKTTPRSLRHFPYRDANGKVDIDHLRDAISRIPQSSLPATLRDKLQVQAEKLLARQHNKSAMPSGKCTAGHDMPVDKSACPDCGAKMAYKSLAKFADGSVRVLKESVLTSETDGHVHAIDIDDPSTCWMDMYSTSYQTLEGAESGHSHSWTFDETTGVITIGADSGHTHTIDAVVPADALVAYAAIDAARDAENLAAPTPVTDEESGPIGISINIAARNSTPSSALKHAANTPEKSQMPTEQDKQIADLTKRAERAERIAKMTGAHKTHFDTLTGDDAEAFLAKSTADRETVIGDVMKRASEATAIVYTSKTTGAVFRKSDDPRMVDMAKREDEREEKIEKAEVVSIAKSHLGQLVGDDEVHVFVVTACRKHAATLGDAGAALLEKTLTAAKGWNALATDAKKAKGFNPGADATGSSDPEDTIVALEKGLFAFCKAQKIEKNLWTDGLNAFVQTTEGAALKRAYDESAAG